MYISPNRYNLITLSLLLQTIILLFIIYKLYSYDIKHIVKYEIPLLYSRLSTYIDKLIHRIRYKSRSNIVKYKLKWYNSKKG